jgi:Tfp pilus assembly protein PilX
MRRQRGWAFLIVLIALAIVAFLARDALRAYFGSVTAASAPRDRGALPTPDATQAAPAVRTPVERARGAEATVLQQAEERGKRVDERAR